MNMYTLETQLENNLNLKIIELGVVKGTTNWNYKNISSPYHRLYFMLDGKAYVSDSSKKYELMANNIYLIPGHNTFNYFTNTTFEKFYVHFKWENLINVDVLNRIDEIINQEDVYLYGEKLKNLSEEENFKNYLNIKGIILQVLSNSINEIIWENIYYPNKNNKYNKYKNILDYITNKKSIQISITELAYMQNQSINAFSKSFKKDFGISPKQFIQNYIIQKAKEMLVLTDNSIKEIAYDLGFLDAYYFSKFFKRHVSISPVFYRKNNCMYKCGDS